MSSTWNLTLLSVSPERLQQHLEKGTILHSGYESKDFRKDPARTDIVKTWEGLLWLLTGKTAWESAQAEIPWRWCMLSDQILGTDNEFWGFNSFYALPDQVSQVAEALAQITEAELMQRLQASWRRWRTLFPEMYTDKAELRRVVGEEFEQLRNCYLAAAAQGNGLVTTPTYVPSPAYFMYYKKQLIGEIFSDGGDFPWSHGYIEPTPAMQGLQKYAVWEPFFMDMLPYHPWEEDLFDSKEYPKNNRKRFLMSDNYKAMRGIDRLLQTAKNLGKKVLTLAEMQAIPELEDVAHGWRYALKKSGDDSLSVRDMRGFRAYLHPRNWRIVNSKGVVNPQFGNPPHFNPKEMTLGWR